MGNTYTVCIWSEVDYLSTTGNGEYDWVEVWAGEDMQEAMVQWANAQQNNDCVSLIWRSAGKED
jgi:hypothetical protein